MKKMWFTIVVRWLAWLAVIGTLLGVASVWASPSWSAWLAFGPWLIWPSLTVCLVLLPFMWRKRSFVLATVALAGFVFHQFAPLKILPPNAPPTTGQKIRALSYNCRFFNSGTWFSQEYRDSAHNQQALLAKAWLLAQPAEIKCLQEFFDDVNSPIFNNEHTFLMGGKYQSYFVAKPKHDNGLRFGMAIFSAWPIVGRGELFLSNNTYNGAIYADVKVGQDTIRVINVHLESARLSRQAGLLANLSGYARAAAQRAAQTDLLLAHIGQSPHPVLLCGDLNELSASSSYQKIASVLAPAFKQAGQGWGGTYLLAKFPLLQIDHQFCQSPLRATHCQVRGDLRTSDHLPLVGEYQLMTGTP